MSHVVQIKTQVRDPVAVSAACGRLGLAQPVLEDVKLFNAQTRGLAVRLEGWRYPVVFDCRTGESQFDNYEGHWGKQEKLDQFLQAYAVEKVKIEARRQGHSVAERWLEDGQVKLTVQVGGVA